VLSCVLIAIAPAHSPVQFVLQYSFCLLSGLLRICVAVGDTERVLAASAAIFQVWWIARNHRGQREQMYNWRMNGIPGVLQARRETAPMSEVQTERGQSSRGRVPDQSAKASSISCLHVPPAHIIQPPYSTAHSSVRTIVRTFPPCTLFCQIIQTLHQRQTIVCPAVPAKNLDIKVTLPPFETFFFFESKTSYLPTLS
jgi:hypothetical protein